MPTTLLDDLENDQAIENSPGSPMMTGSSKQKAIFYHLNPKIVAMKKALLITLIRTYSLIVAILICAFAANSSLAQRKPANDERFAEVTELLENAVADEKVIGHNALIFKDGEVVFYDEAGQRNSRKDLPIQRDTIFRIYSMSKPITSVAAMQLVEAGKLDLDAPVSDYIPAFAELKVLEDGEEVEPKRKMIVRDLFRHTSGLTYGFFGNTDVDKAYRKAGVLFTDANIEEMANKLGEIPLLHHPGQQFHYSASTDVLGRVIEVASEMRFDEYLQANIFDPLGMEDTFFTVPEDKRERFSELYRGKDGSLTPAPARSSFRFLNANDFDSGGGGLCSTIDDYLKFCQMLLGGGTLDDQQILKQESLDQMFTNQLSDIERSSRSFQFGLGFRISKLNDYSWGGAAGTRFWVNPEKQLAILYMVQINPYGARNWGSKVREIVYDAIDR